MASKTYTNSSVQEYVFESWLKNTWRNSENFLGLEEAWEHGGM